MKVLHITTVDTGGAYKAAFRLHESLSLQGIESKILVRTKLNPASAVEEAFHNPIEAMLSKGKNGINMLFSNGDIMNDRFGTDLSKHPLVQEASVIFLHWINSFLSYKDIEKLGNLGKPVIWVMHDMWLFTGGCHVDGYCGKYENRCGNCPLISGEKENDLSRKNFLQKMELLRKLNVTITGPSGWIVEQAGKSEILHGKKIVSITNTLNTTLFCPLPDREKIRQKYGICSDKKVILFGAADNGTENENKGFRYLREAFSYLPVEKYVLLIFGNTGKNLVLPEQLQLVKVGYVTDEKKMVELYNAADVLVNPSNQESFGYTVCEAMACGIPAVGFPIGGIKEQIQHRENGYLAKYHDAKDLAAGIRYCAENRDVLGANARQTAQRYSYDKIGKQYKELCEEQLGKEE